LQGGVKVLRGVFGSAITILSHCDTNFNVA